MNGPELERDRPAAKRRRNRATPRPDIDVELVRFLTGEAPLQSELRRSQIFWRFPRPTKRAPK
jgi:hypothetical protein